MRLSLGQLEISVNRPYFPANASWNTNGATLADYKMIGNYSYGLFVDIYDTVYLADYTNCHVWVWTSGSSIPTRNISGGLMSIESVFVTSNGDVYVDNGYAGGRVDKWELNGTIGIQVMNVSKACSGLFIDLNNTLYCSMWEKHQVTIASLDFVVSPAVVVAGTGSAGASSSELNGPVGIFVDTNFDLYVTDSYNNRVQKFAPGHANGSTVMGNGALISSPLNFPRSVILDGDGNLFVSDSRNNRIVMLGPNGFRCVAACLNATGSSSGYLNAPGGIAFDSCGNILVADTSNNRIQKFLLRLNRCGKWFV
jgi:hypothetical protein